MRRATGADEAAPSRPIPGNANLAFVHSSLITANSQFFPPQTILMNFRTLLSAAVLLAAAPWDALAAPAVGYGLEEAKKNMAAFETPPGLRASLFAAEPMIQNPTNIDIDHRGRLWAIEAVDYRLTLHKDWPNLRPEGDRVVILADADGDGFADQETTFWQSPELKAPLGICVLPGKGGEKKGTQVIVSAAPNVWLLTDTDGDDKADKSEVLLKVGGSWDHDHQIHAFTFGPDGKLYLNFGNETKDLQWPDGKPVIDLAGREIKGNGKPYRQGMVFRCDLREGKLANFETLAWNFRNNYEVCIDSFGNLWQSDNDDDGNKGVRINYVMEFGNYGYTDEITGAGWSSPRSNLETEIPLRHWHLNDPGVVPNLLQTGGGSPTGILINEGVLLGPAFANQLIHCDAGPRTVRAYPVEKKGAGFTATMIDLLTSKDQWYRPSDVAIAPDGSLFVADWYDPGVGGHNMGDREPGKVRGRIYRVAPPEAKSVVPKIDLSSASGAAAALQSPNKCAQYLGWQTLHEMGAAATDELAKLWKHQNPRFRARALGLAARIKGHETRVLAQGLADSDPDIRTWAVRLTTTLAKSGLVNTTPLEETPGLIEKLVKDPSPAVRRQIAVSLHGAKEIEPLWVALALQHDGQDRWYLEALGIGAAGHEESCFDAWLAAVGEKWNTPAGRDLIWRMRAPKAATYLAKILRDKTVSDAEKARYLRAFDFLPATPEKTRALVELATLGPAAEGISREALTRLKGADLKAYPEVGAALQGALDRAKGTAQFVELVRDFGATGQGPALLDTALAISSEPAANDALKLLFADPAADQIIDAALATSNGKEILNLLGTTGARRGIARLTAVVTTAEQKPELRHEAVKALARTQAGAEALIKLAKNNQLPPDLAAIAGSALRMVQYASLKTDIDQIFPAPAALGGKPLPPIAELVKLKGDAAKGRAVFERAESSCIICHRIGDKGSDFGPALGEIGTKLPKEAIYENIINPNAGVSMGFETTQLAMKDGTGALGIVRSETREELVLALPGGAATKVRKRDIAKRDKFPTSMMPSGLNQALTQQDLVDLVEYLGSLKAK